MVFSSYLFLFYFLPLALLLYYAAPRRAQHLVLTAFSYVFYGWANPLFAVLLFVTTLIDYIAGRVMAAHPPDTARGESRWPRPARLALVTSICSNVAMLGFFKSFNFGVENLEALADSIGMPALRLDVAFKVTLPLGISFYTFQSMSYAIDVYRGHARPIRNFIDFACFVSMFPQLVAGPIIRFSEVANQLASRTHTVEKFARGVAFFSLGLSKKVLLANPCGKIADLVFEAGSRSPLEAWYGVTAYAFQIYFDFSGYSDMAIGLGLMLGFVFAKNFDAPYRSQSITEFWRRWHISLSTWLRDYLYVPLGGNRKGPRPHVREPLPRDADRWPLARRRVELRHLGRPARPAAGGRARPRQGGALRQAAGACTIATTFGIVLVTWVFFRATDLPHAVAYLGDMLAVSEAQRGAGLLAGIVYEPYYLGTLLLAGAIVWGAPQTWDWTRRLTLPKAGIVFALLLLSAAAMTTQAYNPFIYYIF